MSTFLLWQETAIHRQVRARFLGCRKWRLRREGGMKDGQIIRGGMESDGRAVGRGAADDHADDAALSGNDRVDKAHDYDLFKTDGG